MKFICEKCERVFEDRAHLARHEARKTPCQITPAHQCACGRRYAHPSGLYRHRKNCAGICAPAAASRPTQPAQPAQSGPPAQHITIHNVHNGPVMLVQNSGALVQNSGIMQANVMAMAGGAATLPGWPKKWPPQPLPRPFDPPRFTITLEMLRRAMAAGTSDPAACLRGEPVAVAALLVEIVKSVHELSPADRNMYLDPSRADQVLVYVPERWEVRPLLDAIRLIFGRVIGELAEALPGVSKQHQDMARGAGEGYRKRQEEVVKRSRIAMAAHLKNLQIRTGEASCWMGEPSPDAPAELREFGTERHGQLTGLEVVAHLENALQVYNAQDYAEHKAEDMAQMALNLFARLQLRGQPGNLTALLVGDGNALVHTRAGWRRVAAAQVAAQQVRSLAQVVAMYIESAAPDYMRPLAEYLRENAAELAAEEAGRLELLTQYSRAAERHYTRTKGPEFAAIREEIASSAISRAARGVCPGHPGAPESAATP